MRCTNSRSATADAAMAATSITISERRPGDGRQFRRGERCPLAPLTNTVELQEVGRARHPHG
jgi:hypothetical protein